MDRNCSVVAWWLDALCGSFGRSIWYSAWVSIRIRSTTSGRATSQHHERRTYLNPLPRPIAVLAQIRTRHRRIRSSKPVRENLVNTPRLPLRLRRRLHRPNQSYNHSNRNNNILHQPPPHRRVESLSRRVCHEIRRHISCFCRHTKQCRLQPSSPSPSAALLPLSQSSLATLSTRTPLSLLPPPPSPPTPPQTSPSKTNIPTLHHKIPNQNSPNFCARQKFLLPSPSPSPPLPPPSSSHTHTYRLTPIPIGSCTSVESILPSRL